MKESLSVRSFTGQSYDRETGLYHFMFREYDPVAGVWTTTDPIKDGWDWWAYCGNDPVNYVDSLGLYVVDFYRLMAMANPSQQAILAKLHDERETHKVKDSAIVKTNKEEQKQSYGPLCEIGKIFIQKQLGKIGMPYWLAGGQYPIMYLPDRIEKTETGEDKLITKAYNNLDANGKWGGYDCCGLAFSSWRETVAEMIGISVAEVTKVIFPLMNQKGLVESITKGELPFFEIVADDYADRIDKSKLMPGDMIVVDIIGELWVEDPKTKKNIFKEDFNKTIFEHIITYIGKGFSKELEDVKKQKGKLYVQDNPDIIHTTGTVVSGAFGSPDARLGAENFVAACNLMKYENSFREMGLQLNYIIIRTNWEAVKEYYYKEKGIKR